MNLHDRIMAQKCKFKFGEIGPEFMREAYRDGFKECKNKSANIAKQADELMAEMAGTLNECLRSMEGSCNDISLVEQTCDTIQKYVDFKETTK